MFDDFPNDNVFQLVDDDLQTVLYATQPFEYDNDAPGTSKVLFTGCVPEDHCYVLTAFDGTGDGMCDMFLQYCGGWELCLGTATPICLTGDILGPNSMGLPNGARVETVQIGNCIDLDGGGNDKDLINTQAELNLEVFPNPVRGDYAMFSFTAPKDDVANVQVISMSGEVVATPFNDAVKANQEYKLDLDASGLNSGIYFVKLATSDQVVKEKIVIVK
jgi:hypothetical protein